jgi:hypothetical protein
MLPDFSPHGPLARLRQLRRSQFTTVTMPALRPVAQRLDQQGEGGRVLPAARVVEVIPRPRGAPVLEHSLETTLLEMGLRQVLRHMGQTESGQRPVEHLDDAVDDELAFDADLQFAVTLFEFPGVRPPWVGRPRLMQYDQSALAARAAFMTALITL